MTVELEECERALVIAALTYFDEGCANLIDGEPRLAGKWAGRYTRQQIAAVLPKFAPAPDTGE